MMGGEVQTCPDRIGLAGPREFSPGGDTWDTHRWTTDEAEAQARIDEFARRNPGGSAASHHWKWSWGPPRTCSFCGGIHPEDAIRLVAEGWEVEPTGKGYKRYLNPPGTQARHNAFIASMRDRGREPGEGVPSVWSPTPPVKLYIAHLDREQCERFNAALDARKG